MRAMLKRIALLLAALILVPSQAFAQDQADYDLEGVWAFQIDEAVIFLFELDQMPDGEWRARWTRPEVFGSNGVIFNRMSGATRILATSAEEVDDNVQLSFPDPRPDAVPNIFLFEQVGDHQVTMTYVGTDLQPFPLIRVVPGTPLGPFDNARIYDRDNAVTEAEYVEPEILDEAVGGVPADGESAAPVDDEEPAEAMEVVTDDASEAAVEALDAAAIVRSCSDLESTLSASDLDAMWGEDYVQIGDGLDIREYAMDDGETARVTLLGERVYVNGCGSAA